MKNRRLLALRLCVVVLGAALVACDGGTAEVVQNGAGTPTPTRTVVGTTPTIGPTASATETPATTAASEGDIGWGVATVEVATGDVVSLYEGAEAILLPEARNGGVWLDTEDGEAIRYTLDGTPDDRVAGWGVIEAPRERVRSYFTEVGTAASPMLVEDDGRELLTVEGARIGARTFSPDGRWLAWLDWTDEDRHLITVADLESGAIEVAATVSPCACDGFNYLEWSPSSRYLAYYDPSEEDTSARGIYLLEVGGSDEPRRAQGDQWVVDGWVEANDGEYLLTLDGRTPTLTPAGDGDAIVLEDRGSSAATLADLVAVFDGDGPAQTMAIVDPVSGQRVRELRGVSDAVLTPDGIATAVISRNDLTCTGVEVSHPDFEERLDCTAEDLRWSPDGRYLALIPQDQSAPVQILDVTTGETIDVPHVGPRGTVPEWSEDSRYLVWVWGSQV